MKDGISANEFANLIGVAPKTVTIWIKEGKIPNVKKIGNRFHIPLEEVRKAKTLPEYPPPLTEDATA